MRLQLTSTEALEKKEQKRKQLKIYMGGGLGGSVG